MVPVVPLCGHFRLVQLSSKPGLFVLADEVIPPGEVPAAGGKRMLALFRISEADDLGMALGRLFLPGSPERLAVDTCFARYALIADATQRHAAYSALQSWVASSASGIPEDRRTENREPGTGNWVSASP
jgi:hypothetical protein